MLFCPQQTDFFVLSLFSSKSNCSRLYSSCSQFYLLCLFEALFKKLLILLLPFQKEKHALSKKQELGSTFFQLNLKVEQYNYFCGQSDLWVNDYFVFIASLCFKYHKVWLPEEKGHN